MAEKNQAADLVKAMQEMKANDDNAYKTAFVKELLKAKLQVPVNISPAPENGVIKQGSTVSYMALRENRNDKKLLLVFTSMDEFKKFSANGMSAYILTHGYPELCAIVRGKGFDGFVIDPLGENVAVSTVLMDKIKNLSSPLHVTNEKVHIKDGRAALTPADDASAEEMKETLRAYLETQENISKCYLMQTLRDGETEPTFVVVPEFTGDERRTFNGIANAARKHIRANGSFGMMRADDKTAAAAVADIEPFYTKQ